jgi:hypothetical protein
VSLATVRSKSIDSRSFYQALDRVDDRLLGACFDGASPMTDVELAVVSELAEGGDRVVVEHVFGYAAG